MKTISEIFTDTEERILDIYVRKDRKEVIRDIETAMLLITDPELSDNCKSLLLKLQAMSDGDFDDLDL